MYMYDCIYMYVCICAPLLTPFFLPLPHSIPPSLSLPLTLHLPSFVPSSLPLSISPSLPPSSPPLLSPSLPLLRYAYRDHMTDVVVQDLLTNEVSRIKCRDLVKRIAIYKNRLAVSWEDNQILYTCTHNYVHCMFIHAYICIFHAHIRIYTCTYVFWIIQ